MIQPPHAAMWLRQHEAAAAALASVGDDELRKLDEQAALAQSEALLSLPLGPIPAARRTSSGLVEQQRLFRLSHR